MLDQLDEMRGDTFLFERAARRTKSEAEEVRVIRRREAQRLGERVDGSA